METANIVDSDGLLVEERVICTVKGVKFMLSASILNQILMISNPPPANTPTYTNEEIFSTLIPGKEVPDSQRFQLSFKPSEMPQLHRIIWYIWARNFVQKGGSYTHLTPRDYRFFTAFIRQHPLNIGHWVFKEMIQFKFASRKTSYVPFPSLVSLILFYHKIWYVGPPANMKYIPAFGKSQLNLMKINLEAEGSGQSRAPPRSQARASQSFVHEAQSAPPPPPLGFEERIREMIDEALASHRAILKAELDILRTEFKMGLMDVKVQLDQLKEKNEKRHDVAFDQMIDLDAKLSSTWTTACVARDNIDKMIDHFQLRTPSSSFGFTSAPSTSASIPVAQPSTAPAVPSSTPTSPSFTFPSPPHPAVVSSSPASSSTPATVILSSPITPSTEIFPDPFPSPVTPSTVILPSPSHSVLFPATPPVIILPSPSSASDNPPAIDDAKGGEEDKDA